MKVKKFAIWLTDNPPEGQKSNHSGIAIGDTGWRAYHVHDSSVWDAWAEEGYLNLTDEMTVYDESTVDGETIYTFNAESTITVLITAMSNVAADDTLPTGFIIITLTEIKQLLESDTYQSLFVATQE